MCLLPHIAPFLLVLQHRMTFEAYLASKKIDSEKFLQAEPASWLAWHEAFQLLHPNSFTAQKLYLINAVRRRYPLPVTEPASAEAKPAAARPVIKIKPKLS